MNKTNSLSKRQLSLTLALLLWFNPTTAEGQRSHKEDLHKLSLPGKNWALVINLADFQEIQSQMGADGQSQRLSAISEKSGMMLTLMLTPAFHKGDSKYLRDLTAGRLQEQPAVKKDDFRISEYHQMPTLEYIIKEFGGLPLNQKHLNAFVVKDGAWIDIHLSKTQFEAGEEVLFYSVLDSLSFQGVRICAGCPGHDPPGPPASKSGDPGGRLQSQSEPRASASGRTMFVTFTTARISSGGWRRHV